MISGKNNVEGFCKAHTTLLDFPGPTTVNALQVIRVIIASQILCLRLLDTNSNTDGRRHDKVLSVEGCLAA